MTQYKTINLLLERFRQFLISSWGVVNTFSDESIKNDWLQANWELLVEAELFDGIIRVNLAHYGDGADGASDRVFLPEALSTHSIRCKAKSGLTFFDIIDNADITIPANGFTFKRFVCVGVDGWYHHAPPFNMFQVEELENAAFSLSEVRFELSECK